MAGNSLLGTTFIPLIFGNSLFYLNIIRPFQHYRRFVFFPGNSVFSSCHNTIRTNSLFWDTVPRHQMIGRSVLVSSLGVRSPMSISSMNIRPILIFTGPCIVILFLDSKTNQMHQCIKFILFWNDTTCFGRSFRPSSGVQYCTYSNQTDC